MTQNANHNFVDDGLNTARSTGHIEMSGNDPSCWGSFGNGQDTREKRLCILRINFRFDPFLFWVASPLPLFHLYTDRVKKKMTRKFLESVFMSFFSPSFFFCEEGWFVFAFFFFNVKLKWTENIISSDGQKGFSRSSHSVKIRVALHKRVTYQKIKKKYQELTKEFANNRFYVTTASDVLACWFPLWFFFFFFFALLLLLFKTYRSKTSKSSGWIPFFVLPTAIASVIPSNTASPAQACDISKKEIYRREFRRGFPPCTKKKGQECFSILQKRHTKNKN